MTSSLSRFHSEYWVVLPANSVTSVPDTCDNMENGPWLPYGWDHGYRMYDGPWLPYEWEHGYSRENRPWLQKEEWIMVLTGYGAGGVGVHLGQDEGRHGAVGHVLVVGS